jgi:O-antigen/teichoic acid export membrane protein
LASHDHGTEHTLLTTKGRGVLVLRIAAAASSFMMYVALARALGVDEYGIFIYALTWLNVILLIGKFGMDLTILRFLPGYVQGGDWSRARGVLRFAHLGVGAAALILVVLGLLVAYAGRFQSQELRAAFAIGLLSVPLIALSALRQGVLRALHSFLLAEVPDGLIRPSLLVIAVGLVWAVAAPVSAGDAMLCYLAVNTATLAIGTFWFVRALPKQISGATPSSDARTWFMVSVQIVLHTGVFQLINQVDVLMLGVLAEPQDVARYSAASRLAWFVTFGIAAMSSIAAPVLSAQFSRQDILGLRAMVLSATRRGFAFATVVSLALAVLGTFVLAFFGPDFESAYRALLVLLAGQLINAFWGLGSYVMIMMDRQRQLVLILVGALCLSMLLNWLLIPAWGFMGAAAATAITMVAWSGGIFLYCWTSLRVRVSAV